MVMNSAELGSCIETSRYFLSEKINHIKNGSYERDNIPEDALLAPQEIVSQLKEAWIRHNSKRVDQGAKQLEDSIARVKRLISYKNGLQKGLLSTPEEVFLLRILETECNRDKHSFGWMVDSISETLHVLQCEGNSEAVPYNLQEKYDTVTADYSAFTQNPNCIADEPFKGISDFLSKYIKIVEEYASLVEKNITITFNDASEGLNLFKKSNEPCNAEFLTLLDRLEAALNIVERNWRFAINNLKKMEKFAEKIEKLAGQEASGPKLALVMGS